MVFTDPVFTQDEADALGDVRDKRVLVHLGGSEGEEALALISLGAHVVAIATPDSAAEPADAPVLAERATELGLDLVIFELDEQVYPEDVRNGSFDLVYVTPMSVTWIADHDGWTHDLFEALAPGGRLVIYDEHPDTFDLIPLSEEDLQSEAEIEEAKAAGDPEDPEPYIPDRFEWTVDEFLAWLEQAGFVDIEAVDLVGQARFVTAVDVVGTPEAAEVPSAILITARKP